MMIPDKLGSEYYRSFLTRQGQAFYDLVNAQLIRQDYSGRITFPVSNSQTASSDAFAAVQALKDDRPEHFYLGYHCDFLRRGTSAILKYQILYSSATIDRIREQLRRTMYNMVRGTANLPMFDREALVYERIAQRLSYANHGDVRDHSIVGPVLMSAGVCEGHNALLLLCFRRIGIPCIKVYGTSKTEKHCWTIAWIDGCPVHCDVTWDGSNEGVVCFNYLNLSDRQIAEDHFCFKGSCVPECTTETLNYYTHRGFCVHSYAELQARIKNDSRSGSPILIHFSYDPPATDYFNEVQRALASENIYGNYRVHCHADLKNVAVIKG